MINKMKEKKVRKITKYRYTMKECETTLLQNLKLLSQQKHNATCTFCRRTVMRNIVNSDILL